MPSHESVEWSPVSPPQRPSLTVILWLVVLGFVVLSLPFYGVSLHLQNDVARLEATLPALQALSSATPAAGTVSLPLVTAYPTLVAGHMDWPAVMQPIRDYNAADLTLLSLTQTENQLTIRGRAVNESAVAAYARRLDASGRFERVVVQSVVLLPSPTPAPTTAVIPTTVVPTAVTPIPTATTTPTPTWTPTPDQRDEYEPDDVEARPIFLGQAQTHNFHPAFDVDEVTFLAKAGRYYEVVTTNLAPGVDTFLTVTVGETIYTNDDAAAGTLTSKVTFQAPAHDVHVWAQVSNRGPYGPEMVYQLVAREFVPTATATSAPVLPTTTPTPSLTPSPTPTPSTTPDLRDIYEPNDIDPNVIAVGETQVHNFFPDGDIDKVGVLVKNGRTYQVQTGNLALGVDTVMRTRLGSEQWENDDYDVPGSGNLASAICFAAAADDTAVVTITNAGQQFAPNKTYTVNVREVPFLTPDVDVLAFGPVVEGGENPPPQSIVIEGTEPLDWTAETETTWLNFAGSAWITGTTPMTLPVSVDISGLEAGHYTGEILLSWASFCHHPIGVTLQVEATAAGGPDVVPRLFAYGKNAAQNGPVEFVIVVTLKSGTP